jgi:mRNA-degrading endonuclease RelE of RelBE toxin-antitoxin system
MDVRLHKEAEKYFDRMNEPYRKEIADALEGLRQEPPKGKIKPLTGHGKGFRLRAGNYRILFRVEQNYLLVTEITKRRSIQRRQEKKMNTVTKQEIHKIIDSLPNYKLEALRPLLLLVSGNNDEDDDTYLTAEEAAEMDRRVEDFYNTPSSYTPLDDVLERYKEKYDGNGN